MKLSRSEAIKYGKRGGRAKAAAMRYNVEGEILSLDQIATRVGVHRNTIWKRMRRPGPVTWQKLKTPGS